MSNDLVANLIANDTGFTAGVQRAGKSVDGLQKKLAATAGNKTLDKTMLASGQILDDFSSQIGTAGLGAAIRATSNNVSALAGSINPAAGLFATLGMVIAAQVIPKLFDFDKALEENKKRIDYWADSAMQRANQVADALRGTMAAKDLSSSEDYSKALEKNRDEAEMLRAELAGLNKEIIQQEKIKASADRTIKQEALIEPVLKGVGNASIWLSNKTFGSDVQYYDTLEKEKGQIEAANKFLGEAGKKRKDLLDKLMKADEDAAKMENELGRIQADEARKASEKTAEEEATKEIERKAESLRKVQTLEKELDQAAVQRLTQDKQINHQMDERLRMVDELAAKGDLTDQQAQDLRSGIEEDARLQLAALTKTDQGPRKLEAVGYGSKAAAEAFTRGINGYGDDQKTLTRKQLTALEKLLQAVKDNKPPALVPANF